MKKNYVVIGATSAIAQAMIKQLADAGNELYLIARNEALLSSIAKDTAIRSQHACEHMTYDASNNDGAKACLTEALTELGTIDGLIIAHGTLPNQTEAQGDLNTTLQEFQINATSYIALLTVFANHFEKQQSGQIVVFSSCAGDRGRQSNYLYGASKSAISAFTAGLRNRLFKKGVHVLTVKPGFVDTPMTQDFKKGLLWAQPSSIAKQVIKAMTKHKDIIYTPGFWRYIMLIIKSIPERVMKRLSL